MVTTIRRLIFSCRKICFQKAPVRGPVSTSTCPSSRYCLRERASHPCREPMGSHPEERDFAASTVLHEADNDVLRLCGDCGFGLIVQACLICHYLSTKFNRHTPLT